MKDLKAYLIVIFLGLLMAGAGYAIFGNNKGAIDETKFNDMIAAIDVNKPGLKSAALAIEVQDSEKGGVYTVERCPAITAKTDVVKFEDDFNNYFTLELKKRNQIKVTGTTSPLTVADTDFKDTAQVFDMKFLTQGRIGLPAIVPKPREIQQQIALGLLSLKDTPLEKDIAESKVLTQPIDKFLTMIFDETVDATTKMRKGLVGLQLMSPELIRRSGITESQLKGVILFEVCEVKAHDEIVAALKTYSAGITEEQIRYISTGIEHLSSGDIVAIPQENKYLVKDTKGVARMSNKVRLERY